MFEWQNNRIKKLEMEKETLRDEYTTNLKRKHILELSREVQEYLSLLDNDNVSEYISLIQKLDRERDSIQSRERIIKKIKQGICFHRVLYFLSDNTFSHDRLENESYYSCTCLECGVTTDFMFFDGKRRNSICIFSDDDYNISSAKRDYEYMKMFDFSLERMENKFNRHNKILSRSRVKNS